MSGNGLGRLAIGALGSALFAAACGGASMTTYTPVNQKTKYSEDSLFEASRKGAENLGYIAKTGDNSSHSLDTREKEVAVSSVPRLSYRYSFHIETAGGVLAITTTCTQNSATNEHKFDDCGSDRP